MSRYSEAKMSRKSSNSGQALLIVLLTMAVAIIVVLSVVSKSVTDVAITNTEEDSMRAFSAAEAGVEEALLNVVPGSFSSGTGSATKYDTSVAQDNPGTGFNYPEQLLSGDTGTIWFVGRDNSGTFSCPTNGSCARTPSINLCWGNSGTTEKTAAEVTVYYDPTRKSFLHSGNPSSVDYSGIKAYTLTIDPDPANDNGFTKGGDTPGHIDSNQGRVNYRYCYNFTGLTGTIDSCLNNNNTCLVMAKVRLLYNTTAQGFGMRIANDLPAQGFKITSSGYANDDKTTQRKVEVFQGYPEPPSIFDSTLFSLKGLEK